MHFEFELNIQVQLIRLISAGNHKSQQSGFRVIDLWFLVECKDDWLIYLFISVNLLFRIFHQRLSLLNCGVFLFVMQLKSVAHFVHELLHIT